LALDIVQNAPKEPIPLQRAQLPIPPVCLVPLAPILPLMVLPLITRVYIALLEAILPLSVQRLDTPV